MTHNLTELYLSLVRSNNFSEVDSAVLELSLIFGLRISSILSIKPSAIDLNGNILISQGKGSKPIIVHPSLNYCFWQDIRCYGSSILSIHSRYYYYRLFIRLGLYERFDGHKNRAVTHYPRHMLISGLHANDSIRPFISGRTGHINIANIKYYVHDKKNTR